MRSVVSATALKDGRGHLAILRKYLAASLDRLIREREWDQRRLAEMLGVTETYLSRIMNERQFPSEQLLEKMATLFRVDPEELLRAPGGSEGPSDPVVKFIRELAKARGYDLIKKS